ncbi:hypothetical protein [Cecembia rubra]|uniref:Uncharacterized protein n=1 Tax=Cecembia rubra TaxID=1485585 RepID=A0A2P8EES2_9BACT|nr:hypothetical protein [Cecembia rubra]PSL07968.1 hypothetical protein CLV48_101909 [Cecembia rubra]
MRKVKITLLALGLGFMSFNPLSAQTIELPDWPPHPEENLCRCKSGDCYGVNLITFRARCGQGDCSSSTSNCPTD